MIKQTLGRVKTLSKAVTRRDFDALDLLRSDHMKVEAMLLQLRIYRNPDHRASLFRRVKTDLEKHMKLEEAIFYPACAEVSELQRLIEHSYDEHQDIKSVLSDLKSMSPSSQRFGKTVTHLIAVIEEHVSDEENKLFPDVRKYMDDRAFRRLNRDVQDFHSGAARARPRRAA